MRIFSLSVVQSGSSDSTLDCGGIHEAPAEELESIDVRIQENKNILFTFSIFECIAVQPGRQNEMLAK